MRSDLSCSISLQHLFRSVSLAASLSTGVFCDSSWWETFFTGAPSAYLSARARAGVDPPEPILLDKIQQRGAGAVRKAGV